MTTKQLAALKEVAEKAVENYAAYGQRFERKFQPATCLALLKEAERRRALPTIVCLCGSTKFMEAFQEANLRLTIAGEIVLSVGTNTKSDAQLTRENYWADPSIKIRLDELHKRKIDLADYVYVLNVGGYIGESTRSEIDYALCRGKEVRYLEQRYDYY
jgi:hypothetical protein